MRHTKSWEIKKRKEEYIQRKSGWGSIEVRDQKGRGEQIKNVLWGKHGQGGGEKGPHHSKLAFTINEQRRSQQKKRGQWRSGGGGTNK